jgi:hypothetical protein
MDDMGLSVTGSPRQILGNVRISIAFSFHYIEYLWLFYGLNDLILSSRSAKVDEDVKKRGGGFTKLCSLSPQLQEFVGVPELARTGVF